MERCPVCKARLKQDTSTCPRCRIDLSISLSIEEQAKELCYQSVHLLKQGEMNSAVQTIEQSIQLKRDSLALALRGFIKTISLNNTTIVGELLPTEKEGGELQDSDYHSSWSATL